MQVPWNNTQGTVCEACWKKNKDDDWPELNVRSHLPALTHRSVCNATISLGTLLHCRCSLPLTGMS